MKELNDTNKKIQEEINIQLSDELSNIEKLATLINYMIDNKKSSILWRKSVLPALQSNRQILFMLLTHINVLKFLEYILFDTPSEAKKILNIVSENIDQLNIDITELINNYPDIFNSIDTHLCKSYAFNSNFFHFYNRIDIEKIKINLNNISILISRLNYLPNEQKKIFLQRIIDNKIDDDIDMVQKKLVGMYNTIINTVQLQFYDSEHIYNEEQLIMTVRILIVIEPKRRLEINNILESLIKNNKVKRETIFQVVRIMILGKKLQFSQLNDDDWYEIFNLLINNSFMQSVIMLMETIKFYKWEDHFKRFIIKLMNNDRVGFYRFNDAFQQILYIYPEIFNNLFNPINDMVYHYNELEYTKINNKTINYSKLNTYRFFSISYEEYLYCQGTNFCNYIYNNKDILDQNVIQTLVNNIFDYYLLNDINMGQLFDLYYNIIYYNNNEHDEIYLRNMNYYSNFMYRIIYTFFEVPIASTNKEIRRQVINICNEFYNTLKLLYIYNKEFLFLVLNKNNSNIYHQKLIDDIINNRDFLYDTQKIN